MMTNIHRTRSAFTLVEIMIVVAIIGLLAALAVPGFVKARKQSQGRRIINDARQQDAAIDQWALEKGKTDGAALVTSEISGYLKAGWKDTDLLGGTFVITPGVGTNQIKIAATTKSALDGVGIDWGNY
ncbi:MAG: type II secretion system protein [Verrucomicrobiia bacterium]